MSPESGTRNLCYWNWVSSPSRDYAIAKFTSNLLIVSPMDTLKALKIWTISNVHES